MGISVIGIIGERDKPIHDRHTRERANETPFPAKRPGTTSSAPSNFRDWHLAPLALVITGSLAARPGYWKGGAVESPSAAHHSGESVLLRLEALGVMDESGGSTSATTRASPCPRAAAGVHGLRPEELDHHRGDAAHHGARRHADQRLWAALELLDWLRPNGRVRKVR
jgi:hypothetical protein